MKYTYCRSQGNESHHDSIVTLCDLKDILPSTNKKALPTVKQLRDHDQLLLFQPLYDGDLRVFSSGFAVYRAGKHTAVIRVDRVSSHTYEFSTADRTVSLDNALRTDFDLNAIMRAAIDATEEDPAAVRKITEAIVACLKHHMETPSFTAKRFMGELDKATRKRVVGGSNPTDFDAAVAVVKNALPTIVAAVADTTGFDRTVVDRIAFSELLAAKKMLVNTSRVASGSDARKMMDDLQKADLRGAHGEPDTNGVEVE